MACGSLSRVDYDFGPGDNHDFGEAAWGQVLGVWGGAEVVDFGLRAAARVGTAERTEVEGWSRRRRRRRTTRLRFT